ncbi:MAG: serine/threonine-protein phosphatase, partial [Agathobacter sp.]|nr:serine/threonine-protein phosphatase [Agathobacter sp.]
MKAYSMTDTGVLREMNQDYFFMTDSAIGNLPNLYIVADGMGGHRAGDYASRHT